jgi:hypothetical protein
MGLFHFIKIRKKKKIQSQFTPTGNKFRPHLICGMDIPLRK